MAIAESALIERYFRHLGAVRTDVVLGIGDDAAVVRPSAGSELVQTTDSLVEHVHFLSGSPPRSLGHRVLAVNLSDLAAMGATPAWALLSLTLPHIDESWLSEFAIGFGSLARQHCVALIGGNLSRGPLSLTVQLTGLVANGSALRRSGGRSGDQLWVSGSVGDAAQGLELLRGRAVVRGSKPESAAEFNSASALRDRFEFPTPRVALGDALRGLASACIDLSDGLMSDLPRLAAASGCGAQLDLDRLPTSEALRALLGDLAWRGAVSGGEDYELCFAAAREHAAAIENIGRSLALPLACCGQLRSESGVQWHRGGAVIQFSQLPFDHFNGSPKDNC